MKRARVGSRMDAIRSAIDGIDRAILDLLNRRASLAQEIGRLKEGNGKALWDPARESKVISSLISGNAGPLPPDAVQSIFREIISACRAIQAPPKVAYLGPEGTFTHQAAVECFGKCCCFLSMEHVEDLFRAVERGKADFAMVPAENSLEGGLTATLDCLMRTDVKIIGEHILRIIQVLLSREKELGKIQEVYSHPLALRQCRRWLDRHLPHARVVETFSTAAAARIASRRPGTAALGSASAAAFHGLRVLACDIQDWKDNFTRFLILGRGGPSPTGRDRTSLLLGLPHRPGSLARALEVLADEGINLTRIESRPVRERPWEYVFFLDLEGHLADPPVARGIQRLREAVLFLKVLGSYPRGIEAGHQSHSRLRGEGSACDTVPPPSETLVRK
jgi:chorismate mutase/prephenate dehydratase